MPICHGDAHDGARGRGGDRLTPPAPGPRRRRRLLRFGRGAPHHLRDVAPLEAPRADLAVHRQLDDRRDRGGGGRRLSGPGALPPFRSPACAHPGSGTLRLVDGRRAVDTARRPVQPVDRRCLLSGLLPHGLPGPDVLRALARRAPAAECVARRRHRGTRCGSGLRRLGVRHHPQWHRQLAHGGARQRVLPHRRPRPARARRRLPGHRPPALGAPPHLRRRLRPDGPRRHDLPLPVLVERLRGGDSARSHLAPGHVRHVVVGLAPFG